MDEIVVGGYYMGIPQLTVAKVKDIDWRPGPTGLMIKYVFYDSFKLSGEKDDRMKRSYTLAMSLEDFTEWAKFRVKPRNQK